MTDELARRTHAVFVHALEVEGAERDAFVRNRCAGDAALEARVRKLLAAVPRATNFLETPALATAAAEDWGAPEPGKLTIRGYEVARVIGAGGMATVYEARQEQPHRTVALKVLSRALASTSAVRRFKYETEVLARLQHPGIAQIFEAGTCDDGAGRALPFFAMELVADARGIVEFCEQRRLPLAQRLAMLADVCDAVQHGHQHGVIHRDLKPANILVGADGRPRIIDFGVARPADPQQAELTMRADARQLIGTLSAMSPEQCAGEVVVDVRTDVYSLGAVLYQMIGGCPPYELRDVSIPEAVRIITHDEPRRLSALAPAARGDLEAIVATAMAKTPAQRYASAAALGADLRRYLRHEPVDARAPTAFYQLSKFARRNRPLVAALAGVIAALAVGIAATARMAMVADGARQAETRARQAAEQRERELEMATAFQESQLGSVDVRAMGERMRTALLESAQSKQGGATLDPAALEQGLSDVNFTTVALRTLDESVLERSLTAIREQFANEPLVRARLLQALAGTMGKLGLPERAEPVIREALELRRSRLGDDDPDTLQSSHSLGSLLAILGREDEAIAQLRDTYERRLRLLGPDAAPTLRTAMSLGGVLRRAGKIDEAAQIWGDTLERQRRAYGPDDPESLASLNNMGVIHAVRGELAKAEECWRELLQRRRRLLGPTHPDVRGSCGNLGIVLQEQGKLDEARPLLEEDLAAAREYYGDDHPSTLNSMMNLVTLVSELQDYDAAESLLRECLARRRRTLGPEHPATLRTQALLGLTQHRRGASAEGQELLRAALETQVRIVGDDRPETLDSVLALCAVLRESGNPTEAAARAAAAVARARQAGAGGVASLGRALVGYGRALRSAGLLTQAEAALREGYDLLSASPAAGQALPRDAATALADYYDFASWATPCETCAARAALWRTRAAPGITGETR